MILSAPTNSPSLPRVSSEVDDLLEQGDSRHYDSCQRTGGKLNVVKNEVKFLGKALWLFIIGQRRSVDSEGFLARAKIRLLTKDMAGQEPAAFYVERPYGQHAALLQNLTVLQEWVGNWCRERGVPSLPLLIAPVWDRDNGGGRDFQQMYGGRFHTPLYCPSAGGGYQDTMTRGIGPYDFFEVVPSEDGDFSYCFKMAVRKVYKNRPSQGGVYLCALREYRWNPQKFMFQYPSPPRRWRGMISAHHRGQIEVLLGYLGYPRNRIVFEDHYIMYRVSLDTPWLCVDHGSLYVDDGEEWTKVAQNNIIYSNLPSLGFYKPVGCDPDFEMPKIALIVRAKITLNLEPLYWGEWSEGEYTFTIAGDETLVVRRRNERRRLLEVAEGYLKVCQDDPSLNLWAAVDLPNLNTEFD
jgi:hypothetical protein